MKKHTIITDKYAKIDLLFAISILNETRLRASSSSGVGSAS